MESINQSIEQSNNQSNNQSTKQSNNQSINRMINQSIECIKRSINQSIDRAICQPELNSKRLSSEKVVLKNYFLFTINRLKLPVDPTERVRRHNPPNCHPRSPSRARCWVRHSSGPPGDVSYAYRPASTATPNGDPSSCAARPRPWWMIRSSRWSDVVWGHGQHRPTRTQNRPDHRRRRRRRGGVHWWTAAECDPLCKRGWMATRTGNKTTCHRGPNSPARRSLVEEWPGVSWCNFGGGRKCNWCPAYKSINKSLKAIE